MEDYSIFVAKNYSKNNSHSEQANSRSNVDNIEKSASIPPGKNDDELGIKINRKSSHKRVLICQNDTADHGRVLVNKKR